MPSTSFMWLSKGINGVSVPIHLPLVYMSQMVSIWLLLACHGYYEKRVRSLFGRLLSPAAPS